MRRILLLAAVFCAALAAGCASSHPQQITFAGGNGLSFNSPVIILGSKTIDEGFTAEKRWLQQHYPGYTQTSQQFLPLGDRRFDIIELTTAGGQPLRLYFDVTDVVRAPPV